MNKRDYVKESRDVIVSLAEKGNKEALYWLIHDDETTEEEKEAYILRLAQKMDEHVADDEELEALEAARKLHKVCSASKSDIEKNSEYKPSLGLEAIAKAGLN